MPCLKFLFTILKVSTTLKVYMKIKDILPTGNYTKGEMELFLPQDLFGQSWEEEEEAALLISQ